MSAVPKLNSMASSLFAKKFDREHGQVEENPNPLPTEEADPESAPKEDTAMEVDGDNEVLDDIADEDEVEGTPESSPVIKRVGRKPIPRKYRGAVGAIRRQQKNTDTAYRRLTLFRRVKQIVRKEMKLEGIQFSANSVHLIATAMENIMLRKATLGSALTLSGGKTTLLPRYALLGLKIADQPDLLKWSAKDYEQCDELLPKSQFRNTELDVTTE